MAAPQNARATIEHLPLQLIDISRIARPFGFVSLGNYFMLLAAMNVLGVLEGSLTSKSDFYSLVVAPIAIGVYGFSAWVGWRNIGVLGAVIHPYTMGALLSLAVFSLMVASVVGVQFATGPNIDSAAGGEGFGTAFQSALIGFVALAAAASLAILHRVSVPVLGVTLRAFLKRSILPPSGPHHLPPSKPLRGVLFLVMGILLLLVVQLIPNEIAYQDPRLFQAFYYISAFGFFLLIYARHYFEPDFRTLLAKDQRPPVLLLRSFADEERVEYLQADRALFDFSLESRLASHFAAVGPFIAIGAPHDKLPHLGAIRVQLSDTEWQSSVTSWMNESGLIILMAGTTHWIGWELKKVVDLGHASKLLLMFPQSKIVLFGRKKGSTPQERLAVVREAFQGTIWARGLAAVYDATEIRSITFEPDGCVVVVTSRPRNRESYHLAALVADDFMRHRQGIAAAERVARLAGTPAVRRERPPVRRLVFGFLWMTVSFIGLVLLLKNAPNLSELANPMERMPANIQVSSTGRLRAGDFHFLERHGGPPRSSTIYKPGEEVHIAYHVDRFGRGASGMADIRADTTMRDPVGLQVVEPWSARFHQAIGRNKRVYEWVGVPLPLYAPPGEYLIDVAVHDALGNGDLKFQSRFQVAGPLPTPANGIEIRDLRLSQSKEGAPSRDGKTVLRGGGKLYMSCAIVGLQFKKDHRNARMALRVIAPDGSTVLNKPDFLTLNDAVFYHPANYAEYVTGELTIRDEFPRGIYTERYIVQDRISGRSTVQTVTFEVE